MDFNVGDRVKYIGTMAREIIGKVGTVKLIKRQDNIEVDFDEGGSKGVLPSNLIKIEPFKIGDKVRLKDKYYDMPDFKEIKRVKRKTIASYAKEEFKVNCFISSKNVNLSCWKCFLFNIPVSLIELVEEPKDEAMPKFKLGGYTIKPVKNPVTKQSKRKWTYDEILQAKVLSKRLLGNIFDSGFSVTFYVKESEVDAFSCYGLPKGNKTKKAKPSHHDEFNVWIGKCVCLCKLTDTPIPDFILN